MFMKQRTIVIKQQTGAVLIVGLVLLLILTVIGLASIRGSDLQERMAGNMRDRNIAFQASEAALREGENILDPLDFPVLPSFTGSVIGYWPDLNKSSNYSPSLLGSWPYIEGSTTVRGLRPTIWTAAQWEANSVQLDEDTISGLTEQPRYTIEKVIVTGLAASQGSGVDHESVEKLQDAEFYRITSRGLGLTADAEVILQSTFAR
ncbi:hypothetical protein O59_001105 [Cellvibrio sp. BR]|nr:hypothetical protein O59_001105 [Cellvibrio sp. BR]